MKYLILVILLSSCSAQWHLKQAIKKDPSILKKNSVLIDTLILTDSFTSVDTFSLSDIDTFVTDTGKVRVTLYKYKNMYKLKTEVKVDTVHFLKDIECPPSVIKKEENCWRNCMYAFLIGCLLTSILMSLSYAKKLDNTK